MKPVVPLLIEKNPFCNILFHFLHVGLPLCIPRARFFAARFKGGEILDGKYISTLFLVFSLARLFVQASSLGFLKLRGKEVVFNFCLSTEVWNRGFLFGGTEECTFQVARYNYFYNSTSEFVFQKSSKIL